MFWIPVCFAVYMIWLVLLLFTAADDERKKRSYTAVKMLTSTTFVVAYLVMYAATNHLPSAPASAEEMEQAAAIGRAALGLRPPMYMLLIPLLLCWGGDLLLGLYQQRGTQRTREAAQRRGVPFRRAAMAGAMLLFGTAHLLFLRFVGWFGLPWGWLDAGIAAAGLALSVAASYAGRMHMGRMRIPAYFYAGLVSLLMARGIHLRFAVEGAPARAFGSGTIYFFLSDFLILFLYFYPFRSRRVKKVIHLANLATYYFGIFGMILAAAML